MNEASVSTFDDPCEVPLKGLQLIEASAGTGKTWTIASLALRFLIEKEIPIGALLIVTFTRAATAELSVRIRTRIEEALAAFAEGTSRDPFLQRLIDQSAQQGGRERARHRLALARACFDEAAIVTIHGFCQRALLESAFVAGLPFERELVADDRALLLAVARDEWRRLMETASSSWAAWLLERVKEGPKTLADLLGAGLTHADRAEIAPPPEEADAGLEGYWEAAYRRLRTLWQQEREAILAPLTCERMNQQSYKPAALAEAERLLSAWLAPVFPQLPVWDEDGWKRARLLTAARIAKGVKKGQAVPAHPFYDALDDALLYAERLAEAFESRWRRIVASGLIRARQAMRVRRAHAGRAGYDDLVEDLAAALEGAQGERLAKSLRARYSAALVDEFQDTDHAQWTIFRRLFGDEERPLILVGDPKQAIYAFRGADIHAYLAARRHAERHRLRHNRRSDPLLLEAINALFARARPFLIDGLEYEPALPAEMERLPFHLDDAEPAPLVLWRFPLPEGEKKWNKAEAREAVAEAVAEDIVHLLHLADEGRVRRGDAPLAASDIAILVRTRRQAQIVSRALARRGVGCASLGGGSVWQSEEAEDLARLLSALVDPTQEGRLRAALATRLYGWRLSEIVELSQEERLGAHVTRFHEDRLRLERDGFLAFWRHLVRREDVVARLLAQPFGERRLTNYRHLAELIQREQRRQWLGAEAVLRLLAEKREEAENEDNELRLDSDAHLVRIVTIHAAKGLQYPVVYCPFLWDGKTAKAEGWPLLAHEGERAVLDFGSRDFAMRQRQAEIEAAAEELRLAYVALTRAQHRLVIPWLRCEDGAASPLAWLLFGPREEAAAGEEVLLAGLKERWLGIDEAARFAALAADAKGGIAVLSPPTPTPSKPPLSRQVQTALMARPFPLEVPPPWTVQSFSALAAAMVMQEGADHDPAVGEDAGMSPEDDSIHAFPRGARAGSCLHALLERCDFQRREETPDLALRMLEEFGFEPRWQEALVALVHTVALAPLDGDQLRLSGIAKEARLTELEFTFPNRSSAARVGYMKGFIDLVFCAHGRWYIVDYKSNWLGPTADHYTTESLTRAMQAHRYDLQARIYAAALYRLLAAREPAGDWDARFGGVFYLFLRGLDRESPRGIVWLHPSREEIEEFLA